MNEGVQMMRGSFRVSAVSLCLGFALCAAGCFGSGDESPVTTAPATMPSSQTTASTQAVTTTQASGLVGGLPSQYSAALSQRPIVLVFYAPGGVDDEKVLTAARELQSSFSGYTFLMYDYRIPSAYGDLTRKIKTDYGVEVGYLPFTLLIARNGTAAHAWSGYVDKGTLNQALLNLGRE